VVRRLIVSEIPSKKEKVESNDLLGYKGLTLKRKPFREQ